MGFKGQIPWNKGKGQSHEDDRGYRWIYTVENGRRVARREHRVVMEKHLGRKLEPWEAVHHKDENPSNNDVSNLEVVDFAEHTAMHHRGARRTRETRRNMETFANMRAEIKRVRELNAKLLEALKEQVSECPDPGCTICFEHQTVIADAEGRL